jgi:uncharacterized protein (TIGR03118 family)
MFSRLTGGFSARTNPRRRETFQPRVEGFEDRLLLSTTFLQTNLTSDIPGLAQVTDPNLVNPWGIVPNPNGPFWVNDNGTGLSTLYGGDGQPASLVVTVPSPDPTAMSSPTGIVFNSTSDFVVDGNGASGPAFFIFATEDGTISGWNPTVNLNNAILKVDNSAAGAVYKGLALGSNSQGNFLYATNFHDGTVDVFDSTFAPAQLDGNFIDPHLPRDYAPFGIANINGLLYVTYGKQNAPKHDDVAGRGHGFIDVFDTDGHFMQRLVTRGDLNSPWGLAVAPANFGRFSNDLLVGNFGDGRIHAYDPQTGEFKGTLRGPDHKPITIDGLWGLSFGNGQTTDANTLFFTAGINHEQDGLFGSLQLMTTPQTKDDDHGMRELGMAERPEHDETPRAERQDSKEPSPDRSSRPASESHHGMDSGRRLAASHARAALVPANIDDLFGGDLFT